MFRKLPREVIDHVEIAVDARARNRQRGADVSDSQIIVNANLRQAEVAFIRDAGVESNRTRIEIVVFGKEPFVEPVVTKPQFVNFVRGDDLKLRERHEMDRSRRSCVVTGKNVAGENRERERLIARAEEVTSRKLVVLIKRVIDLGD